MKKPILMKPEVFDALKQIQEKNIDENLHELVWKNEKAFQKMGISLNDIIDVLGDKDNAEVDIDENFYLVDMWRANYIDENFTNPDIKVRGDCEREYLAAVRSR